MESISAKKLLTYSRNALDDGAMLEIPCLYKNQELKSISHKNNYKWNYSRCYDNLPISKYYHKVSTDETEFEVETILDYITIKGLSFYYVKWKNWGCRYNTWEPAKNLSNCSSILKNFYKQKESKICSNLNRNCVHFERVLQFFEKGKCIYKHNLFELSVTKQIYTIKEIKHNLSLPDHYPSRINKLLKYAKLQKALKEWERHINIIIGSNQVEVTNEVDFTYPPNYFTFINDYIPGKNVVIPNEPVIGCDCINNCQTMIVTEIENKLDTDLNRKIGENGNIVRKRNKHCCSVMSGSKFPYNKYGRVTLSAGIPIYECNKLCKCDPKLCQYRVVQKGNSLLKFSIFRTKDGRGWGVRTQQKIRKNMFVMEYVGEIITNEEAEKRGQIYDSNGITYLFDLDFCDQDNAFTIDAGHHGNISHFVNHSCDPNLVVYAVYINNLDIRLPRIALFARCDIAKGEELTFDYLNFANSNFQSEKRNSTFNTATNISFEEQPPSLIHLPITIVDIKPDMGDAHFDFHNQLNLLTPPPSSITSSKDDSSKDHSDPRVVVGKDEESEVESFDPLGGAGGDDSYLQYSTPLKVVGKSFPLVGASKRSFASAFAPSPLKTDVPISDDDVAGLTTPPPTIEGRAFGHFADHYAAAPEQPDPEESMDSTATNSDHTLALNAVFHDSAMEINAKKLTMNDYSVLDATLPLSTARIPCKCKSFNCRKFIF